MKTLAFIVLVISCSIFLFAQAPPPSGSVVGTVQDETGALIPGATVTAESPEGKGSAVTDRNGAYRIASLPAGTYTVTASLPGFQTVRFTDVTVRSGQEYRYSFTLRVAQPRGGLTPIPPSPRPRNLDIVANTQTLQGTTVLYRGNVKMTTDSVELTADELDFNTVTNTADVRGNVRVRVLPVTAKVVPLSGAR